MKILMTYPKTPKTFYSFHYALKFISKKSVEPPLGLLTVAAMLPQTWDIKLVDLNVDQLKDRDIQWADYVFISGMNIQVNSFNQIVKRCNQHLKPIVAGGPMVSTEYKSFPGIDSFLLNEAENAIGELIKDMQNGTLQNIYKSEGFPSLTETPIPRWDLLNMKKYATMNVQYSRGCPFNCDFCSIVSLFGNVPRVKETNQFIAEMDSLYHAGWRGGVFIVDDNFIGNKKTIKNSLLPELGKWSIKHKYPFIFTTEVSINLADDEALVDMMVKAGFGTVFIGIETINEASLRECNKNHNLNRDLLNSVHYLHKKGLIVSAGFIIGFDNDTLDIFERQRKFIQESGIATAMVGLLNAPSGTRLYDRLKSENRLIHLTSGDNMDGSMNFQPQMNYQKLVYEYKKLLSSIYSPKEYYERLTTFLDSYSLRIDISTRLSFTEIKALFKSVFKIGIFNKGRRYYWKLFFRSLLKSPKLFPVAMTLAVYGYHFRKVAESI